MRFLRPTETDLLAEAIAETYGGFVLLGAYGGLRLGEMTGLRWGRLDLLRRRVDVAEISYEVGGKVWCGPPKTKAARRTVPLPEVVATALAATTKPNPDSQALVFTSPEGLPIRAGQFRQRIWRAGTDAADLGGLRIHDLRPTAAAVLHAPGSSALVVTERHERQLTRD